MRGESADGMRVGAPGDDGRMGIHPHAVNDAPWIGLKAHRVHGLAPLKGRISSLPIYRLAWPMIFDGE